MKIFKDYSAEKFAKNVFEMYEGEQKGRGSLFLKKLKLAFEKSGYFKLSYRKVLEVAKTV